MSSPPWQHHIKAAIDGVKIAHLLVSAIAAVLTMDDDVEAEPLRDLHRLVARHVVDEDHVVDQLVRDVRIRPLEGAGGVVRRHDDDDLGRAGLRPGHGGVVRAGGHHGPGLVQEIGFPAGAELGEMTRDGIDSDG